MTTFNLAPLTVMAHTPAGFSSGDPTTTPSLDGILAWVHEKRRLGPDFGTNVDVRPVTGLPLAVEEFGAQWWYSCGVPEFAPLEQHDKFVHRRFDAHDAERFLVGAKRIISDTGPHKNLRRPHFTTVAGTVSWKAIGDVAAIRDYLTEVPAIGSGWSRGLGRVTKWEVVEGHEGEIRRWLPFDYARARGLWGRKMRAALRPPAWLPENNAYALLPDVRRAHAAPEAYAAEAFFDAALEG